MVFERRILINNTDYYVGIELKYDNKGMLKKMDDSYFDMGDLSILIKEIEEKYDKNITYYEHVPYLNDIFYIYNHFPFLLYIKDISYTSDNKIHSIGIINKEEILMYIDKLNVKMKEFDGKNSVSPLLF